MSIRDENRPEGFVKERFFELYRNSLHIKPQTLVGYEFGFPIVEFEISPILRRKDNYVYCRDGNVIGYIWDDELSVIPFTNTALHFLMEMGFYESQFFVPFSKEGTYPVLEKQRWENMMNEAQKILKKEEELSQAIKKAMALTSAR